MELNKEMFNYVAQFCRSSLQQVRQTFNEFISSSRLSIAVHNEVCYACAKQKMLGEDLHNVVVFNVLPFGDLVVTLKEFDSHADALLHL